MPYPDRKGYRTWRARTGGLGIHRRWSLFGAPPKQPACALPQGFHADSQIVVLQAVLANIPHLVAWKDTDGLYLGCNHTFALRAGLRSPDEIIGLRDNQLPFDMGTVRHHREVVRAVLATGAPEFYTELTPHSDAHPDTTFKAITVPLRNPAGEVTGALIMLSDISARKGFYSRFAQAK